MLRTVRGLLWGCALCLTFAGAGADDIGWIEIDNQSQAETAESICDHAYGRIDNRFLVSVSPAERGALAAKGLAPEIILADTDPERLYFVMRPPHPGPADLVDLEQLGLVVRLDAGLRLVSLSQTGARLLADRSGLKVVPLAERTIRFRYVAPSVGAPVPAAYPADTLAGLVSQDSIYAFNKRLEDFYTRYIWTDSIDRARDWLVQKFTDWGYTDLTTPAFEWDGGTHYNIKVVKPGLSEPDKIVVIGAHYDAITLVDPGPMVYAPGSDDNGSGTALVMEVARVLADVPLRKTVVFIPFSAEEVGLVGSEAAAEAFAAEEAALEVMFNYDMVGYTEDDYWNFNISGGSNLAYRDLMSTTAERVSDIIPVIASMGASSDHYSFYRHGFNVVNNIEGDFNDDGWHTNLDLTSRMDFPYMAEVVKAALVSLAVTAETAYPVTVENIVDVGDGQSLEIHWSDRSDDCVYHLYWGVSPGGYDDSAMVPAGDSDWVVEGLSEGVPYYFLAIGETPDGYRALTGVEGSETPQLVPRAPRNVVGQSGQTTLSLCWSPSTEADFSHFNLYRRIGSLDGFGLYQTGITDTAFVDLGVTAHVGYTYRLTAVDADGYESAPSDEVSLFPVSFDGGIVVVDEFTTEVSSLPDQQAQEGYLDTIFAETGYALVIADKPTSLVTDGQVGQYSSIFWIDDDNATKTIGNNEELLRWYLSFNTNMLVAGFRTVQNWSSRPISTDHMLFEEFQVSDYAIWSTPDFQGAFGQDGWPSIQIDPSRGRAAFNDIARLTPRPEATVIYTYDSKYDDPNTEGDPCGLAYDGPGGKRVILGFPIYYLSPASATALVAKVAEFFGGGSQVFTHGDLDRSGTVDISDLMLLVEYLFITLEPPTYPEQADIDGYPGIDTGDLVYFIEYLFRSGPAPSPPPSVE